MTRRLRCQLRCSGGLLLAAVCRAAAVGLDWCDLPDGCPDAVRAIRAARVHVVSTGERIPDVAVSVSAPPWGIDRIDQRSPTPDGKPANFRFTGDRVTVYVLDTGLDCGALGGTCVSEVMDRNGHGTLVASLVRSVAPGAELVGLAALNASGYGTLSGVITKLDQALALHTTGRSHTEAGVAVVVVALGTDTMPDEMWNADAGTFATNSTPWLVSDAIATLRDNGLVVVAAAGNEETDACRVSPGGAPAALTVAAMGHADQRLARSNYGRCVSVFAPGTVWSADRLAAGTSIAAGYAAGVAAAAAGSWRRAGPAVEVADAVCTTATAVRIEAARKSPEKLVYSPRAADRDGWLTRQSRWWVRSMFGMQVAATIWAWS